MSLRYQPELKGCCLSYEVRGSGPPVVLIQGVGVHGSGWSPQVAGLSGRYTCLSFDNRGIGRSVPVGTSLTVEQMAEDALALMDEQGWDDAHLIGHSLGGLIALRMALQARRRVRSLSLLCTFARGRDATRMTPWMMWVGLRTRIGPRRLRRRAFLELVAAEGQVGENPDALAHLLADVFGHDLADSPPIVMKQLSAMRMHDVTTRLPELAGIPTLVVSAEHDRIASPASGRAIAAGIPGARYVEISGASHGLPILCADRVNDLLLHHLGVAESHLHS